MIGMRNYGISMLKKIIICSSAIILTNCGVMPGMQNLDVSKMKKIIRKERIEVNPSFIPITPTLIADQKVSLYHYRIAPADVLSINVWQHPEFSFLEVPMTDLSIAAGVQGAAGRHGYLVNVDGQIYFPLVGYVHVAGLTIEQIQKIVTDKLKEYVPNPQINVRVADYRGQKVYVMGEVKQPGFVPITDQVLSIADALALSGGMNQETADTKFVYIIRGNIQTPEIFWLNAKTPDKMLLAENFSLQPKDIIFVSSAPATRWNRVLNQLLPTVQTVWFTQAIVKNS